MIRVKCIFYDKLNVNKIFLQPYTSQKLEDFINEIGYDNIKQIIANGHSSSPVYTVIYEE